MIYKSTCSREIIVSSTIVRNLRRTIDINQPLNTIISITTDTNNLYCITLYIINSSNCYGTICCRSWWSERNSLYNKNITNFISWSIVCYFSTRDCTTCSDCYIDCATFTTSTCKWDVIIKLSTSATCSISYTTSYITEGSDTIESMISFKI